MASKPEDQFAEEFVVSEEGLKADRPGTANTVAKVEKEDKAKTDPQKKQDEKKKLKKKKKLKIIYLLILKITNIYKEKIINKIIMI